ncbi:MAG: hypothetical protein H6872_12930 [Methylobacteriaceae bacterium]|nr:hypothetical protein [Methylobacteriaceae bacterium]
MLRLGEAEARREQPKAPHCATPALPRLSPVARDGAPARERGEGAGEDLDDRPEFRRQPECARRKHRRHNQNPPADWDRNIDDRRARRGRPIGEQDEPAVVAVEMAAACCAMASATISAATAQIEQGMLDRGLAGSPGNHSLASRNDRDPFNAPRRRA